MECNDDDNDDVRQEIWLHHDLNINTMLIKVDKTNEQKKEAYRKKNHGKS